MEKSEPTAETPVDFSAILSELKARALLESIQKNGDTPEVRRDWARQWDSNPPCPDCGSYAHFEC